MRVPQARLCPTASIDGAARYRAPGMPWTALAAPVQLTSCCTLENEARDAAKIRLANGMLIELAGEDIRTGWELEPRIVSTPELDREIQSLIPQLGDGGIEAREQAEKRLREIGLPAIAALKGAAADADVEVRARAGAILRDLEAQVGEPIFDNLRPIAQIARPVPFKPEPTPKYGVRD